MRIGATLLALILLVSFATSVDVSTNKFGSLEIVNEHEGGIEKEIYFPEDSLYYDHLSRSQFLRSSVEQGKINMKKMLSRDILKCEDAGHLPGEDFMFAPVFVGSLFNKTQTLEYEGTCFKSLKFQMEFLPSEESPESVQVTVTASNKKSSLCREALFFSTTERHHIEWLFFSRTHTFKFKNFDEDDMIDLNLSGLRTYLFCDGPVDTFVSVFNTLKLFIGGLGSNPKYPFIGSHVPEYMEKENIKFVKNALGWEMEKRDVTEIDFSDDEIHDGDFLAITRLDGLDEIIMWGTGSHVGHSTVVLTIDGEKHIVESQDAWYWPKHKIQRNTFTQWKQWAKNCDFNVVVLPLKDELRKKFDSEKALQFFQSVEGMPYGYHNFLFSWIDTVDDNYPPVLAKDFIPIAFELFNQILPSVMETFFLQAMNHRLDTKGLNYHQVVEETNKRGTTLLELMAQPELDGWMYSDGYSYVCSCFVVGIYKAAGLFGNMDINAVEFTPRDVYMLNFFNTTAELPEKCKTADPDLPYCQILGKYRLTLPGYSTIDPYQHMNEHCESIGPDYVRPKGC